MYVKKLLAHKFDPFPAVTLREFCWLPQQLSIVGFDDVVLARYLYPALTTMHYPVEQMARCAAQLAIQLYQGITPPPSSNHFNAELVIRDSVAPYFSR